MADQPLYSDLAFPVFGLDTSTELGGQGAGTTPEGVNVRGYEPLSGRRRGGSRAGLSRHPDERVNGNHPVQHLNTVAHVSLLGLHAYGADYTPGGGVDLGGGLVTDTGEGTGRTPEDPGTTSDTSTNNNSDGRGDRNPGREVRDGGDGQQPNRHLTSPPRARNDTLSTYAGATASSIDVLANDFYVGTPGIAILAGPFLTAPSPLPAATASVTGLGTGSRILYTPPIGGLGGTDYVRYRLTDGRGRTSDAVVQITVAGDSTPDPGDGNHRLTKRTYVRNAPYDILEFQYPVAGLTTCLYGFDGTNYHFTLGFNFNNASWPVGSLPSAAALNALAALLDATTYLFGPPLSSGSDTDQGACG